MTDVFKDISDMHRKFSVNKVVRGLTAEQLDEYWKFRLAMCQEELTETMTAKTADDAVDGLIDLIVFAVGTLDAFDIDPHTAWQRVHNKNMEKEPGVKEGRPNPYGFPDLIKPTMETHGWDWTPPTHADNVGLLAKVFDE